MADTMGRHCGKRIVLVRWSSGPGWTHQPAGAPFQDGEHVYCHTKRAAPPEPQPGLRPQPDAATGEGGE